MRQSITQESDYGCGLACYAFALGISYKEAERQLGEKQANSNRFYVKDLTLSLNKAGITYKSNYIKPYIHRIIYREGSIVLIRRSKTYKVGHYLIRHEGKWMDPWINLPMNNDIKQAKSGFRKRLPGKPIYVIYPF